MNLNEWQPYLADVPHLLGNMPWHPMSGMYIASKKTHFLAPPQPTTFAVKDFYPIVDHRGRDPGTYEEYAKDEGGYQIWDEDAEGNSERRLTKGNMPAWIQKRMDMSFEGQPVDPNFTALAGGEGTIAVNAGWHYLSNGYELMDYDAKVRATLEAAATTAYDNKETLYVLATTLQGSDEKLSDDNWWQLFALVPTYPYNMNNTVRRDYRLVSIQPYSQLSDYDDQREIKSASGWKDKPNLNFQLHQQFDSSSLREAVRSRQAQGFTPTAQTLGSILHGEAGPQSNCKIWYKISPFPGKWQSINTQRVVL